MNIKSFLVLSAATAAAVAGAAFAVRSTSVNSVIAERGKPFLPGLFGEAGDLASIKVTAPSFSIAIKRKGAHFVDGASGYPVRTKAVRGLVAGLAKMVIEEKKTDKPARYADLTLAPPNAKKGAGVEVKLKDDRGKPIADVVLGRNDFAVAGGEGQYVRRVGEATTWLARGAAPLPTSRSGWFDDALISEPAAKMDKIAISRSNGSGFELERKGGKMKLVDVPANREPDNAKVDLVSRFFTGLTFDDVRKAASAATVPAGMVTGETPDGVRFTLTELIDKKASDKAVSGAWVRVSAQRIASAPAAKPADGKQATKAGAKPFDVASFNKRVSGFEFHLDANDARVPLWTISDVTTAAQPASPVAPAAPQPSPSMR